MHKGWRNGHVEGGASVRCVALGAGRSMHGLKHAAGRRCCGECESHRISLSPCRVSTVRMTAPSPACRGGPGWGCPSLPHGWYASRDCFAPPRPNAPNLRTSATRIPTTVIPAKAGRSAQRGEHPKDGPEGVSEANHPVFFRAKVTGSQLSLG